MRSTYSSDPKILSILEESLLPLRPEKPPSQDVINLLESSDSNNEPDSESDISDSESISDSETVSETESMIL